jgi:hypothetical protein
MARSEARILVDIWNDQEFLALPPTAQRLYMFLISQPDIAHDGILALRERRWAGSAADLSADDVVRDLRALAAARFVVIDTATEELLVRSFIRRDGVYRQPNVLLAAKKHLALVTSQSIRLAVARELRRILTLPDVPKRCAEVIADIIAELPEEPDPEGTANPSANPSSMATPEGTAISREGKGDVTAVTKVFPLPLSPEPLPPAAGNSLTLVPGTPTQRSKRITDAYAKVEPFLKWPAVNAIVVKAIKDGRWSDDEIQAALLRLANEGRPVTVDTLRVELNGLPPPRAAPPRPSTTNSRVDAALALAAELERQEIEP